MSHLNEPCDRNSHFAWLEWITAIVLCVVLLALGWIMARAYQEEWMTNVKDEAAVIVILALLTISLLLVSVVALIHTRKKETSKKAVSRDDRE